MDRMIYLTMTGAKAAMQRQEVISHNLANVSTTGFREQLAAFRAVPVRGDGASTRVYALETTVGYNDAQGPITATGRNLDVAMKGNAWLAVQGLDGTEAYTRAGALDVDAQGQLVTITGLPVVGEAGPITVPDGADCRSPRTAPSAPRPRARPRSSSASSSWSRPRPRSPAGRTACSAAARATWTPTPPPACRTAPWRAPTSARWRPWWP
jgi:flagellar basal-body rod protein FlgF